MAIGDRTSARPRTIDGVTFHCYHAGILKYEWLSVDRRAVVVSNSRHTVYLASVDGNFIYSTGQRCLVKRFRKQESAMRAAAKAIKKGIRT